MPANDLGDWIAQDTLNRLRDENAKLKHELVNLRSDYDMTLKLYNRAHTENERLTQLANDLRLDCDRLEQQVRQMEGLCVAHGEWTEEGEPCPE